MNKITSERVQILKAEFARRQQRNPRYSLRSFARSLKVSHAILSLVMSGKRPLSRRTALHMVQNFDLSPEEAAVLLSPETPSVNTHGRDYIRISVEAAEKIADWAHYATLSLLDIPKVPFNPAGIARSLNITQTRAKDVIEGLAEIGLIEQKNEMWVSSSRPIKVENDVSTEISRKFHRGLLEKAVEALENRPIEERDFSSITMAIDPAFLPYAKKRIRQFRRELTAELESKGKAQEVYNLTVQLYPVSRCP